jgi:hypothetical protein
MMEESCSKNIGNHKFLRVIVHYWIEAEVIG